MMVVSSKEFISNQNKYFDMALNEDVCIKRKEDMFQLVYTNGHNTQIYDDCLEPDEDFYRAISAEEFKKRLIVLLDKIDKKYAKDANNIIT